MSKPLLRQIRFPVTSGKYVIKPDETKTILLDGLLINITNVSMEEKFYTYDERLKNF